MAATIVLGAAKSPQLCKSLGEELVQMGLVASATVVPVALSLIRGTNRGTETVEEYLVILETDDKAVPRIVEFARSHPAYEMTKVVAIPVSGGSWDYLNRVSEMTSYKKNNK